MGTRLDAAAILAGLLACAAPAAAQDAAPEVAVDQGLRARLPAEIRESGRMTTVVDGSFPPYTIITGTAVTGASADLTEALGRLLGVKIDNELVGGLPALLAGVKSGRYQFAFGPVGDYKDREGADDFVDWVKEYVVFAVPKGNPKGIVSLDTACGRHVAVMAGGSAERVIQAQSAACRAAGKDPVDVQSFTDQPTSVLAVRSRRSDAFFSSQAPLTYFVQQANGQLELTGIGQKNGFEDIYQGAVVAKGSPLGPVLRDGIAKLIEDGTYARVMKRWGLENNMVQEPGIDLGGTLPK